MSSLITFNDTAPAQVQVRRQSTGSTTPLVYNVTQVFSASAGTSYALTAWAAVTMPAEKPYCFLRICGDSDCGFAIPITTNYTRFTYNYESPSNENTALATFEVECSTSAQVALDDVSVTNNALAASASSTVPASTTTTTVFETETLVQSQIYTQVETTTYVSGTEIVLTTTIPTIVYQTVNVPITETRTVSTLLLTTETATTAVPQYVNVTVSSVSTITSKSQLSCCSARRPKLTEHSYAY